MPIQSKTWKAIAEGRNVFISAATGSGKTLAAFLWSINEFFQADAPAPVLYVSPLKALNNDIYRNLLEPLKEITSTKLGLGLKAPNVGIRSGDSTSSDRAKLLRHPPDIFITTPESINIMLTSEKGRNLLCKYQTIIVDEIHTLAASKRGSLFMLNIERLETIKGSLQADLGKRPLQRIALSATVNPLEEVAFYFAGYNDLGHRREISIIADRSKKEYEIDIRLASNNADSWWERQIPLIALEIEAHSCTLIFCNSRRASEKSAYLLNNYFGDTRVFAHHGSLSREYRYWVEKELKEGKLKAVTATNSLELGIDIGNIDRVLLLQPAFRMSSAIQRIGRSKHQVHSCPSAAFIPLHPRDILKSLAQCEAVHNGEIEPIKIPRNCLDILAQFLISETAGRKVHLQDILRLVRRSWTFHELTDASFFMLLEMLAGRYMDSRVQELQARIIIHSTDQALRGSQNSIYIEGRESNRLLIYQSGGTIPDRGYFDMRISGSNEKIGELDEEFVFERSLGDRFTLGNRVWTIESIDNQKVLVRPSSRVSLITPFWKGDFLGSDGYSAEKYNILFEELNAHVAKDRSDNAIVSLQKEHPAIDAESAKELIDWLSRQRKHCGLDIPHRHHIVIEELCDPSITPDTIHFIIHSNWGATVNAVLLFCLKSQFKEDEGFSAEGFYTDDTVVLTLPLEYRSFDILQGIRSEQVNMLLSKNLASSGIFGSRFRMNAGRSLLVLRKGFNQRTALWLQRVKTRNLFERVLGFKDFPIIQETWREVLEDELSIPRFKQYLDEINGGDIRISRIQTKAPSPFASDLLWQLNNEYLYKDDTMNIDTSKIQEEMRSGMLSAEILAEINPDVESEYLKKRRRLLGEYQPDNSEALRYYFQDRRIFTPTEKEELISQLDPKLNSAEVFDSQFYSLGLSALQGRKNNRSSSASIPKFSFFFNKDIPSDKLCDKDYRLQIALEWFDWQGQVKLDSAYAFWGNEIIDQLIENRELIIVRQCCVLLQVFERLLRLQRSWSRRIGLQKSLELLQLESAYLNNICVYDTEGNCVQQGEYPVNLSMSKQFVSESRTHNIVRTLEGASGIALPARVLVHGIIPARLGQNEPSSIEDAFHQCNMIWTGKSKNRVLMVMEEDLAYFWKTDGDESEQTKILGDGRFSFDQLYQMNNLSRSSLIHQLGCMLQSGKVANDSFRALCEFANGSWVEESDSLANKAVRTSWGERIVESRGRIPQRSRLRTRHLRARPQRISGLWYRLSRHSLCRSAYSHEDLSKYSDVEHIRQYIHLLFDRHPILNKQIVNREDSKYRWHNILPILSNMELSGELRGGKICPKLEGLQFVLADELLTNTGLTIEEINKKEQLVDTGDGILWFWLHCSDPATIPGAGRGKKGDHNYNIFLITQGKAKFLAQLRNRGKEIVVAKDIDAKTQEALPGILLAFFHLVLLKQEKTSIQLYMVNGEAIAESGLFQGLIEGGFIQEQDCIRLWKY